MKNSHLLNILTLIFITAFTTNMLYAQIGWFPQPSGTTSGLNSVFFVSSVNGWAAGESDILVTYNGGSNWEVQFSGPAPLNNSYEFNSVYFLDAETGWVAGDLFRSPPGTYHKVIFNTFDAGLNWTRQYINSGSGLKSIYFISPLIGWVVGANTILATVDGGLNWTAQNFPWGENDHYDFRSVCFANSDIGWAAGKLSVDPPGITYSVILKSFNGGGEWTEQYRVINPGISSVWFNNLMTGWAVGAGVILNTSNGGESWRTQATFGNENCSYCLNSVHFENSSMGWVVGGSQCQPGNGYARIILKTNNGGINWEELSMPSGVSSCHFNSVFFTNVLTGWTIGDNGTILKTTNGGVVGFEPVNNETPIQFSLNQNYPNPFNPVTKISFNLPKSVDVKLTVFDVLGSEVTVLVNEKLNTGAYEVEWDGSNYPSGVYFYRITAGEFTETKKMILVK